MKKKIQQRKSSNFEILNNSLSRKQKQSACFTDDDCEKRYQLLNKNAAKLYRSMQAKKIKMVLPAQWFHLPELPLLILNISQK